MLILENLGQRLICCLNGCRILRDHTKLKTLLEQVKTNEARLIELYPKEESGKRLVEHARTLANWV